MHSSPVVAGARNAASVNALRVMIVNGTAEILTRLEPALELGRYDIVAVEPTATAYSRIKREQPDLVILCVRLDSAPDLHVLSMLKLDRDTRAIPVFTCAVDDLPEEDEAPDGVDAVIFAPASAPRMN